MWKIKGLSATDGFRKQNASETLALVGQDAIISGSNYISGVTNCQEKNGEKMKEMGVSCLTRLVISIG